MNPPNRKKIFFLRHGQTVLNKTWVHQYPDTPLSEKGVAQAEQAARHFTHTQFDRVIASPYTRTVQTAEIIMKRNGGAVETNNLFVELRRPKILWGKSWFAPQSILVMGMLYLFAHKEHWHYSDEENLEEFHARSRRALEFLSQQPEEHILVVTHRGFMANLMGRITYDGMDTVTQYRRALWKNIAIKNCDYFVATWERGGEYDDTLTGTWNIEGGIRKTA